MYYWVCVDEQPVDLPTRDIEAAKRLLLERMNAAPGVTVSIDVYPGGPKPMRKLRYDPDTELWVMGDALPA